MGLDIRSRQTEALRQMLNLNSAKTDNAWKILVFDEYGRDIIAPLLSVQDLRECGVTLNLLIRDNRDPIPDVPAVYFVMPTRENVERIGSDCKDGLYERFFINFITAVSRQLLEDLAQLTIESDTVHRIGKIFDQHLSFCTLEQTLFTVPSYDAAACSYHALNRCDAKDADIELCINAITECIFSVFVTLRQLPVIRCPKGNAAEIVAEKLEKKMRDARRDPKSELFKDQSVASFQRPLLVILDRNVDICSTMHHTWTYQALIHDLFNLHLNRCQIQVDGKTKNYDLGNDDKFWMKNKGRPFPEVAEAVHQELEACRAAEQEIKRLKDVMGDESDAVTANDKLASTVSSLPELMEKKKRVDMHINIATALSESIKSRSLDKFYEVEEKVMTKAALEESVLDVLRNPDIGSPADKLRLFVIYYLSASELPDTELQVYIDTLQEFGCDTSCIQYLSKLKQFSSAQSLVQNNLNYNQSSYSSMSNMFKYVKQSSKFMMEGVKNLVVGNRKLPITRIVDCLSELKQSSDTDDYLTLDPKIFRKDNSFVPSSRTAFNEVYVFMVGGGSYVEYQNLMQYAEQHQDKKIYYGSSEVMDSSNFLQQLNKLGNVMTEFGNTPASAYCKPYGAENVSSMNSGPRKRKRLGEAGTSNTITPAGILSTFTTKKHRDDQGSSSEQPSSSGGGLQQIQKSYSAEGPSRDNTQPTTKTTSGKDELFPFYTKSHSHDVQSSTVTPPRANPRSALNPQPSRQIPFLKTPEGQDPVKRTERGSIIGPQPSPSADSLSQRSSNAHKTSGNPVLNKPIDGAPTRRPKVPKEPENKRSRPVPKGSTADNPMTLDSSEEEEEGGANGEDQERHQWCISAAHIGSLIKLDVNILEINDENFEFNFTNELLLAEVKVCVPWEQILKIETHFSQELRAMVIYVEDTWANCLVDQLKKALSRQFPLELNPRSNVLYKRVISLEFVKEPPTSHLQMMGYYLQKATKTIPKTLESKDIQQLKDYLPPVDHFDTHLNNDVIEQDTRTLLVYPPGGTSGSVTLSYADLECLKPEEFLNDSIIDFYLKYIHHELVTEPLRLKTHLFNTFFYKALTSPAKNNTKRPPEIAGKKLTASERMYMQVQKWSKSIDLFSMDYIIVPINEHQHWYLAIICYPWLEQPIYLDKAPARTAGGTAGEAAGGNRRSDRESPIDEKDIDGVLTLKHEHVNSPPISCRPCILMFDSLVANGRNRVVNNLRNYLAMEWKTKGNRGLRSFTKNNFPGIFVEAPLQENFCDCGVFVLQFVEKFFECPINDYRFPVERKGWFSQQDITKKREQIRQLIIRLGPNAQISSLNNHVGDKP